MNKEEQNYLDLMSYILENGEYRQDRTGTGTLSSFSHELRFNLTDSFPLLTTKKLHFKSIAHELLWFLSGDTNIKYLTDNGVRIWNEWANENGDLGPVYGWQWRNWGFRHDQILKLITNLKNNPNSRRHLVSAWNVSDLSFMALPPCHFAFQCYVSNDKKLSLKVYQRSADMFLGVPFNIASYSLLVYLLCQVTGYSPGNLIWSGGDCHIYLNHIEQVKEQLSREPRQFPQIRIANKADIDSFIYEDIELVNYKSLSAIRASISV